MEVLIKNGRIVDCSQDFIGDVYIKDGIINEIGKNLNKDCETINGEGLLLLPSFIDLHAHMRDPGLTYKEDLLSGSKAAVRGGYTAVNLMANTNPVVSTMETVNYVLNKAQQIGLVDIFQAVSITKDFNGVDIDHLDRIDSSVKVISDDGKGVLNDSVMYKAMIKAKEKGFVILSHAENSDMTPHDTRMAEDLMTIRDLYLARHTGCHLHMAHVSTKESMEEIIRAKKMGYSITCEVSPHHLALTDDIDYRVNPPLRKKEDVDCLIYALREGWADAIATDHAPHSIEDKKKGSPGISGIETAFSFSFTKLVKKGHISLNKLSEVMSKKPSRILGLNKGEIKIGYDGDVVLVDIDNMYKVQADEFQSKGKNTPIDGMELYGIVIRTIKGGKTVYSLEG
ncbi:dihydroorotase [Oxobacter pfennigii]|uniref:Dihydroorotase n=1 Tax=Oxobacter pfennigii TaxID=36849 RepID=A0A0P8W2K0_9CLOT|nr:dihydroorotase [Oxobacter pfennigii]KPU42726.1 dihydroorotase [Oxobacter pfennigii]